MLAPHSFAHNPFLAAARLLACHGRRCRGGRRARPPGPADGGTRGPRPSHAAPPSSLRSSRLLRPGSACGPSACSATASPAACGPPVGPRTIRSRSHMARPSSSASAISPTSASPPDEAGTYQGGNDDSARRRRSSTPTSTSGSRPSVGSWPRSPTRRCAPWRTRLIELDRSRHSARTATWTRSTRSARPAASSPTWSGAMSCTWPATWRRPPWPGTAASGTTACCASSNRIVDRIWQELGPGRRELVGGHPELEMALVELYRVTGQARYLELARLLVERRGRGLLARGRFGDRYWQDHEPVRSAREPVGHAVRQVYLDCGVVDVAVETGDEELLAAALERWSGHARDTDVPDGSAGLAPSRRGHRRGLRAAPDRAYAETCASIGSAMLAWRLLLATGEARFADLIERTAMNGVLSGLAADGCHFFYSNPLLRHSDGVEVRRRCRHHTACRVVRGELLPTQPDALPGDLSRPGRDRRCPRPAAPPVRDRHGGGQPRRRGRPGGQDGLPVGRARRGRSSPQARNDPGRCPSASQAGAHAPP